MPCHLTRACFTAHPITVEDSTVEDKAVPKLELCSRYQLCHIGAHRRAACMHACFQVFICQLLAKRLQASDGQPLAVPQLLLADLFALSLPLSTNLPAPTLLILCCLPAVAVCLSCIAPVTGCSGFSEPSRCQSSPNFWHTLVSLPGARLWGGGSLNVSRSRLQL